VHGEKYDYSEVLYITNKDKVNIICPKHGSFWQQAASHVSNGRGCRGCDNERKSQRAYNKYQFIEQSILKHGDVYNYSKVDYINAHKKVEIVCLEHGSFLQTPNSHINGCGCPSCGKYKNGTVTKDSPAANDICYLYTIKLTGNGEEFYKIGISKDYIRRFHIISLSGYNIDIINISIDTRYNCYMVEQKLLNKYKSKGRRYTPDNKFKGWTECYTI